MQATGTVSLVVFSSLKLLNEDPVLQIPLLFAEDKRAEKIDVSMGTYRTAEGHPYLFQVVQQAEAFLGKNKEYLPIEGDKFFLAQVCQWIFGGAEALVSLQTIGGTGALRLGLDLLLSAGHRSLFISTPTWPNHPWIAQSAGMEVLEYPYYDFRSGGVDWAALKTAVAEMPQGSVMLLQPTCHNPTGQDLVQDQWQELLALLLKRDIFPFFDLAYAGFSASFELDFWPIRHMRALGGACAVALSFSKNFGLYGERVGALVFSLQEEEPKVVLSQLKRRVRAYYSSPPRYGAEIVSKILSTPLLKQGWEREVHTLRDRMDQMREQLYALLLEKRVVGVDFLAHAQGFFALFPFGEQKVIELREQEGLYLQGTGRLNMAALTPYNVERVACVLATAMR